MAGRSEGKATSRTFQEDPQAFQVGVEDPSHPDFSDSNHAYVTLRAAVGDQTIDQIPNVRMRSTPTPDTFKSGRGAADRLVVVADAVDDGPVLSGKNDNSQDDPTVRAFNAKQNPTAFGRITATYRNVEKGISRQDSIDVCPADVRRQLVVHVVNFDGSGMSQKFIEEQLAPTAREIWAAACVTLQLDVTQLPNPGPRLSQPAGLIPRTLVRLANGGSASKINQLSTDFKEVMTVAAPASERVRRTQSGEITVYVIDAFRGITTTPEDGSAACTVPMNPDPPESSKAPRLDTAGETISSAAYVRDYCQPASNMQSEDDDYVNAIFLSGAAINSQAGAVGKILAHELAHLVLGSTADHIHEPDSINLLKEGYSSADLLEKRFNSDQIGMLRSCQNSFTRPSARQCQ